MEQKINRIIDKVMNIIGMLFIYGLIFLFGFIVGLYTDNGKATKNIVEYDTTYNVIVLDSIKHNILFKDSIITKLKIETEDEIKKASNASDSAVVEQFKALASKR